MTIRRLDIEIPRISAKELAAWQTIPSAATSDCLERSQAMTGAIKPLSREMRLIARARTVKCMVGDNSALHGAIDIAEPGDVLVCDAGGFMDTALWGGLLSQVGKDKGLLGVVIDGAVRDSVEILEMKFPVFARAVVPAGPHKGFGGEIDGGIACGGVAVNSGDLVVGDADGVTIVPHGRIAETLSAAQKLLAREEAALKHVADGGSLGEIYSVPEINRVKRS